MNCGLRPKSNIKNRNYDLRIYFIVSKDNVKERIRDIINNVYGNVKDCVILKIELPIDSINVYKDDTVNGDYSFYTYSSIPKEYIHRVRLEKI